MDFDRESHESVHAISRSISVQPLLRALRTDDPRRALLRGDVVVRLVAAAGFFVSVLAVLWTMMLFFTARTSGRPVPALA